MEIAAPQPARLRPRLPQDHRRLSVRRRGGHGHKVRTGVRTAGRKLQSERHYDEIIYTFPTAINTTSTKLTGYRRRSKHHHPLRHYKGITTASG